MCTCTYVEYLNPLTNLFLLYPKYKCIYTHIHVSRICVHNYIFAYSSIFYPNLRRKNAYICAYVCVLVHVQVSVKFFSDDSFSSVDFSCMCVYVDFCCFFVITHSKTFAMEIYKCCLKRIVQQ